MSESDDSGGVSRPKLKLLARKTVYRQTSAALGIVSGLFALGAARFAYFLLVPFLSIFGLVMIVGGVLILYRIILGAVLVLVGAVMGGGLGLPTIIFVMLPETASFPLLPVGLILPVASVVLAFLGREREKPVSA